jgi:exosortase
MVHVSRLAAGGLLAIGFLAVYWPTLSKLAADWSTDDNYSHGFFIAPIALFFVWERRATLAALPLRPHWLGLVGIVGSLGLLVAGLLGAELFLSRVSIVTLIASTIVFAAGWRHLGALALPVSFLLLMIPIPAILFNQIAFPLQLLASQVGEITLRGFDIPVLREGNVMILANTSLEVAEACSGIRSLMSLLTLGVVYGYFTDPRGGIRAAIVLATVPIAVVTNAFRVAGTGVAAHYYGPGVADGFFHTFSGWMVFVAAFALLFATMHVLQRVFPPRRAPMHLASAAA